LNNVSKKLPCDKSTLLSLAKLYGFEGDHTDVVIY